MKKTILFIMALTIALTCLTGCGLADKIAQNAQEKIINDTLGGEGKVDLDEDKYVYEDGEGNTVTIGANEWPTGKAADLLPKFKDGVIVGTTCTEDGCNIVVEQVEKSDFEDYCGELKSCGFTQNEVNATYDTTIMWQSDKDENTMAALMYDTEEKILTITLTIYE